MNKATAIQATVKLSRLAVSKGGFTDIARQMGIPKKFPLWEIKRGMNILTFAIITLAVFFSVTSRNVKAENLVASSTGKCVQVNGDPNAQYTLVSANCFNSPKQNWRINALNINSQFTISFSDAAGKSFSLQVSPQGDLLLSRNTAANINNLYWNGFLWPSQSGSGFRRWENIGAKKCLSLAGSNLVIGPCGSSVVLFAERPSSTFPSQSPPLTARQQCLKDCRTERDGCMREVPTRGGPRPQQCITGLRACNVDCPP